MVNADKNHQLKSFASGPRAGDPWNFNGTSWNPTGVMRDVVSDNRSSAEIASTTFELLNHAEDINIHKDKSGCIGSGGLVDELPVAQSTVSQHLKCMKEAGLVQGTIDGPRVCYCLSPTVLERLKMLVGAL